MVKAVLEFENSTLHIRGGACAQSNRSPEIGTNPLSDQGKATVMEAETFEDWGDHFVDTAPSMALRGNCPFW